MKKIVLLYGFDLLNFVKMIFLFQLEVYIIMLSPYSCSFFNLTSTTNVKIKGMVNTRFKSCFLFAGDKVIGSRRDRQITSTVWNWVVC